MKRITRSNVEEASLAELVRVYNLASLLSVARAVQVVAGAVWTVLAVVLFALLLWRAW